MVKPRVPIPPDGAALSLTGPTLRVRIPRPEDAAAPVRGGVGPRGDALVLVGAVRERGRGARLPRRACPRERERGVQLDLVIEHLEAGPIGITGFSEIARRDRRATIGSWLGRSWWGTGANREAKALMCHLGFELLGLERIGSYTNTAHVRSQRALERLGFEREGLLRAFHRHDGKPIDVVVYGLLRAVWEPGPLRDVPVAVAGEPPEIFVSPS